MKLLFFHNSDRLIRKFEYRPQEYSTPTYYWFNAHYSHFYPWNPRYFHLFLKKPKGEKISFFVRNLGEDYKDLVGAYRYYASQEKTIMNEAPILISTSTIIPDLIADAGAADSKSIELWSIIYPIEFRGKKIRLRDDNLNPIPYNQDEVIREIFPDINDALPFQLPDNYPQWNSVSYDDLELSLAG